MRPAKFKDLAHRYVGCKLQIGEGIGTFNEYCNNDDNPITCYDIVNAYHKVENVKPILYHLTQENFMQLPELTYSIFMDVAVDLRLNYTVDGDTLQQMKYMARFIDTARALHIDVDGLVENGEAIDVFSLTVNPYTNEPKK
jgi:hypothetical protein